MHRILESFGLRSCIPYPHSVHKVIKYISPRGLKAHLSSQAHGRCGLPDQAWGVGHHSDHPGLRTGSRQQPVKRTSRERYGAWMHGCMDAWDWSICMGGITEVTPWTVMCTVRMSLCLLKGNPHVSRVIPAAMDTIVWVGFRTGLSSCGRSSAEASGEIRRVKGALRDVVRWAYISRQ